MDSIISYRPFKSHTAFVGITIFCGMFFCTIAGYCFNQNLEWGVFYLAFSVLAMCLAKVLYVTTNVEILFTGDTIHISDNACREYKQYLWQQYKYVHYTSNYKGHMFLILSTEFLDMHQAKMYARKGANSSRVIHDDIIVMYLDPLQNISLVKMVAEQHAVSIKTYV